MQGKDLIRLPGLYSVFCKSFSFFKFNPTMAQPYLSTEESIEESILHAYLFGSFQ